MSDDLIDGIPDDDGAPDEPAQASAVDPAANRKLSNRKKTAERQATEFWTRVFADPIGRREMWGLLRELHPFEPLLGQTPVGFPDERKTWMHLAEQLVGQRIYQTWHAKFPTEIMAMLLENDPRFQKPKGA